MSTKQDLLKERAAEFPATASDVDAAGLIMYYVQTYSPSSADIERLLTLMFERVRQLGHEQGLKSGSENERRDNPVLRGLGAALQESLAAWQETSTSTLRKVFEAETIIKSSNPYYAFEQALAAAFGKK